MSSITYSITRALVRRRALRSARLRRCGAQSAPSVAGHGALPSDHLLRRDPLAHRVGRARWRRQPPTCSRCCALASARASIPRAAFPSSLQLQDSRVLGTEGNRVSSTVDVFDLHQGYLQLVAPWRGSEIGLRAGRQEIALGNERLVGAVNWSNTGRTFDGARVMLAPPGPAGADRWSVTAFAAVMEENGRRFGARGHDGGARARSSRVRRVRQPRRAGEAREPTSRCSTTAARATAPTPTRIARRRTRASARRCRSPSASSSKVRCRRGAVVRAGDLAQRPDRASARGSPGARVCPRARTRRRHRRRRPAVGRRLADRWRYSAFGTMFGTNHPFYGLLDVDRRSRRDDEGARAARRCS